MKLEKLARNLRRFGLTNEEAAMYLFLIKSKSGTIREIHNSKEYALKQRPNLYKILYGLKEKKFVTEEEKGGKKRFFPVAPHLIIGDYVNKQEEVLRKFKESASKLTPKLEDLLKIPFEGFSPIPEPLVEFITGVVNENWSIKEPPEVIKERGLGTIYSIEFETHRQFAGHSAGLAIHIFRYQQHRDESIEEVKQFQREHFELALKSYEGQGFFQIQDYRRENKFLEIDQLQHPYDEFHIKSNVSPDSVSGTTVLLFKEHPTKIITAWGADIEDFYDLIRRITSKFTVIPLS